MASPPARTPRTRLSPDARRAQLLDVAKDMIEADGLPAFTMEALAHRAGVSTKLVFHYFANRLELLQDLLEREYARYNAAIAARLDEAQGFDDIVRTFVRSNFDVTGDGDALSVLQRQDDVRARIAAAEEEVGRWVGRYLYRVVRERYAVSRKEAIFLLTLSANLSQEAARRWQAHLTNREAAIDATVRFILAAWDGVAPHP